MHNTDNAHSKDWGVGGLLFLVGLFNYLDRVTLSLDLSVIPLRLSIGPGERA